MNPNGSLVEQTKIILASPIIGLLATTNGDCDYVSMKGYRKCTIIIAQDNATTVTGTDITLKQATAVAGTGEKALAFTKQFANADVSASDALVETAVTSNTFTTQAVNATNSLNVIEIDETDLDMDNGFDCLRLDALAAVASAAAVIYILHGAKYGKATPPTAITD